MRDSYYSNTLIRCFEVKTPRKETFKFIISEMKKRVKNKTENQIISEAMLYVIQQKNDKME